MAEALASLSGRVFSLLLREERRNRKGTGVITLSVMDVAATIMEDAGCDLVISVAVGIT